MTASWLVDPAALCLCGVVGVWRGALDTPSRTAVMVQGGGCHPSCTSSTSRLVFFFKKPDGANSQDVRERRVPGLALGERGGGWTLMSGAGAFCFLSASSDTGLLFSFFFSHTPRKMPTSPKESGVSCEPHGARGKEMIKVVRFPGSSWCLRWVLIWEESEEKLGPVPIRPHPEPVWVADDMGPGGNALSVCTFRVGAGACRRGFPVLVYVAIHACYKEEIFQLQEEGFQVLSYDI